jgi:hypothetical protein
MAKQISKVSGDDPSRVSYVVTDNATLVSCG